MEDYVKRAEFDNLCSKVERLEKEMDESGKLLQIIDKKIDVISERLKSSEKIDSLKLHPLEDRVVILEDGQKWLRRTIFGAIISIVVEAIIFVIQMKG